MTIYTVLIISEKFIAPISADFLSSDDAKAHYDKMCYEHGMYVDISIYKFELDKLVDFSR